MGKGNFEMKTILLTGVTSGIGRETAIYLNEQGYRLVLVARDEEKLTKLFERIGDHHMSYIMDLACLDQIDGLFNYLKNAEVKLDGMAYCAGIAGNMPFRNISTEEIATMMQVNCYAFVSIAKEFVKKSFSNDGSSIVAISSLSAVTTYPGTCAYSMSKSALITACKVLAKEVLRRKIRVNTVLPGYVETRMMEGTDLEKILSDQPWGYVHPREVAQIIEYLISDKARMITGSQITISGGMQFN